MEGRNSCTTSRPVPAEEAERELIANIVGYLPELDDWLLGQVAEHRAEQANTERALTAARKALQGTERRLERLLDDYERLSGAEAGLVLRRATSVEAERDEAEHRVIDLEAVVVRARATTRTLTPPATCTGAWRRSRWGVWTRHRHQRRSAPPCPR